MYLLPRDTPELGELQQIRQYLLSVSYHLDGYVLILLNDRRRMRSLEVEARRILCGSVGFARYETLKTL